MKTIVRVDTDTAPKAVGYYSQAVVCGEMVYCSAQIGHDPRTGSFVSEDLLDQADQALKNLSSVLQAAGSSLDRAVKVEIFLTDMNYFAAVNELYSRYFDGSIKPARQTTEVTNLPLWAKVSVSCTAALNA